METDVAPLLASFPSPGIEPAPAIVVLPGGRYLRHVLPAGRPITTWLNSLGYAAFVLHYPVGLDRLHPHPLNTTRAALSHLRQNAARYRIDPARLGVLGFSAGGHLAAHVAADPGPTPDARPDFAVLLYPASSWRSFYTPGSDTAGHDPLLGADPTPAQRDAVSIELIATPHTPPILTIHAADDTVVPVRHSLLLTETLATLGVPVELHVLPHGGHGFGLAEEDTETHHWEDLCANWLSRYA